MSKDEGKEAGGGAAGGNGNGNGGGNSGGGNGGNGPNHPKTYPFFVGKDRYEAPRAVMKVSEIKAMISGLEAGDKLQLDGHGNDPDRLLNDDEPINFEKDRGGPLRFTIVPGAGFGAQA